MEFLGLGLLSRSFLASQDSHACVSRDWLQCGFNDTLMLSGVGSFQEDSNQPSEYLSPDEGPVAICPVQAQGSGLGVGSPVII